MKTVKLTQKPTLTARMSVALAGIPNPMQMLRAQERLNKFRALDSAAMTDMGLTQDNVDRATLADFMRGPRQ